MLAGNRPRFGLHLVLAFLLLINLGVLQAVARPSVPFFRPPRPILPEAFLSPNVNVNVTDENRAFFIEIPVDHFGNKTQQSFKNRYWINSTYWEIGGPVFVFDSGEQDAEPLVPYYIQEFHGHSAMMRLAERYKGLAILWEHRFYGASLPFPVNRNTTGSQWQFLNTEQALEDFIFFAHSFSNRNGKDLAPTDSDVQKNPLLLPVHPNATPWIFLGGSYPGIRAALLRNRNPESVFAAWASSAPVQAEIDMASYYKAAERSLTRNCSADWVSVTRFVDDTLMGGSETEQTKMKLALLKARAGKPGGDTSQAVNITEEMAKETSDLSAASILMDPLDFYQYYGFKESLLPFCNLLETKNFTAEPTEKGIADQDGVEAAFDAFLTSIAELDYDSIPFTDDPVADRSWMWQYCSEYGFYQRGDRENPLSIETAFFSLELFQKQCDDTFGQAIPASPQTQKVNKYGGWNMNPSNVLWTNGEFDPWRTMGLASIEDNSPKRTPTVVIPECNTATPDNTTFFGMTYANMVHVSDMRVLLTPDANHSNFNTVGFYSPVSQEPFFTGLGLFQLALDKWLPCFQSRR